MRCIVQKGKITTVHVNFTCFFLFSFTVEKRKLGQKISQVMQEAESMETED